MNLAWEQDWLEQFDNRLDRLMENYPDTFEYEDINFGVRIINDRNRLRRWFAAFENAEPDASVHRFRATRYHGDERGGTLEWEWEIEHRTDFLGLPAAGHRTCIAGLTIHAFDKGLIVLERSLWDAGAMMRQLGLQAPAEADFQ
ncbi:ester cyclase [uncultured Croceicoccus sp.]|uniref:ester cyclase n=1 Tax=uncultured Croceicoccus sp. TaxID=1295329 RepID=UPI0026318DA6|nr:ester cyclase [uncultured Croceicoccus sp.]